MRRSSFALALLLAVAAQPASARCFSIWHFKTPQHCGVRTPRVRVAVARVEVREVKPTPSPPVEPPLRQQPDIHMPIFGGPTEPDAARAMALEAIRAKLTTPEIDLLTKSFCPTGAK